MRGKFRPTIILLIISVLIINIATADSEKTSGEDYARTTIEVFADYQCPYCAMWFNNELNLLDKEFIKSGDVKLVVRHFPLENVYENSRETAIAAECAAKQGKFFRYTEVLFNSRNFETDDLVKYAQRIGLNKLEFQDCLEDIETERTVEDDIKEGRNRGVRGTPTFFINGKKLTTYTPYHKFVNALEGDFSEEVIEEPEDSKNMQQEPLRGEYDATVKITAFLGYNDPFSRKIWSSLKRLFDEFEDISLEFRHFPHSFQDEDFVGAVSGECVLAASSSKTFFVYSDYVFTESDDIDKDKAIEYAENLGVDIKRCVINEEMLPEVINDKYTGRKWDVKSTPTLFINGKEIRGSVPYDEIADTVAGELGIDRNAENNDEETVNENACKEGEIREFTCDDGTKVVECDCSENEWKCFDTESLCPNDCKGCKVGEQCMPYGERLIKGENNIYCGSDGEFGVQKQDGEECKENFECRNNLCSKEKCFNLTKEANERKGLFQAIVGFFGKVF